MLKIAWSKNYNYPLPEGHRFPMIKYDLIAEQLIYEGTIKEENLFKPGGLSSEIILLTHTKDYFYKLQNNLLTPSEIRRTGFPFSDKLVEREVEIMAGTVEASLYSLEFGISLNIAGGTHHAFTNRGEGFCLLNDIAIAAKNLLEEKKVKKVLVIDLDVHQGNGTAQIFQNDPRVFTFSMHGANNYPLIKEKSDLDIPLPDKIEDKSYLKILNENLNKLLDHIKPDFVFYQSGVDVLATDKLGRLGLSREGCRQRDKEVLDICFKNKIPLCISMGGGYSEKLYHIVEAHCNVFRLAQELYF